MRVQKRKRRIPGDGDALARRLDRGRIAHGSADGAGATAQARAPDRIDAGVFGDKRGDPL